MKRKLIVSGSILGILFVSFLAMSYLSKGKTEEKAPIPVSVKKKVKAEEVVYSDALIQLSGTGRVVSKNDFNLSAEVPGKILTGNVSLKKGASFRKGDLLFRIHQEEALFALKARKSRFMTTLAGLLPDVKVDFPEEYAKWAAFFDAISVEKNMPDFPTLSNQQEKVFMATRNIVPEYYSIQADEVRLEKYRIYAPFDGAFSEVYAEVGSVANPGQSLAKLSRTDKLEIELPVAFEEASHVSLGAMASITNELDPSAPLKGKVVRIADFVDPTTQSVPVYIELTYEENRPVYRGQYVRVEMQGKKMSGVMELPRRALVNAEYVYVVRDGKLQKEPVIIHKLYENSFLFSGISADLWVVTEALVNPVEGTEVEIL